MSGNTPIRPFLVTGLKSSTNICGCINFFDQNKNFIISTKTHFDCASENEILGKDYFSFKT